MQKIICISGQLRNGKDTLADYLAAKNMFDEYWKRVSFAGPLKDLFCSLFEFSKEEMEEWKVKAEIPSKIDIPVRDALRIIGNELRQIKSTIWIDLALRWDDNLIISDGRYNNERKIVKEKCGYNVLIYHPNRINYDDAPSESELREMVVWANRNPNVLYPRAIFDKPQILNNVDFILRNDSTLEDLYKKTDDILIPDILQQLIVKSKKKG